MSFFHGNRYNEYMLLSNSELHFTKVRLNSLQQLGITTIEDLLTYYPFRYEVMNQKPYSEWLIGEKITFEAEVISPLQTFRKGRFTSTHFSVLVDEQYIKVVIFNRPWLRQIPLNSIVTIQGIYKGKNNFVASNLDQKTLAQHEAITPVYRSVNNIKQKTIRDSIQKVFEEYENEISDIIPESLRLHYRLSRRYQALQYIHEPQSMNEVKQAYRTLKYEEFLKFFLSIQMMKQEDQNIIFKQPKQINQSKIKEFISHLPFQLTKGQIEALNDILKDMSSTHTMYRLVQGDVGCGKTVVAAIALFACANNHQQGALLAPTEILAQQHGESLKQMFAPYPIKIEVLYSGLAKKRKTEILEQVKKGEIDILIGTHSIFQEQVTFENLGLIIADEQQRFGVEQRKKLHQKGNQADFLLMSATPIPRTLASTLYGDMDISTIETLPSNRKPPITKFIEENSCRSILNELKELLSSGQQLYVICAAVDETEGYDAKNVLEMTKQFQKLFSKLHVAYLHGKMSSDEKKEVMHRFEMNEVQILVSTTVVEVGVNVINATGMVIYDADRFGLSQLHQLRGRIQRGKEQGKCYLLTSSKDDHVKERLNVLVKSNNGFEISYEDLRLRGPGDILGTRQSGIPDFILGNVIEDTNIVQAARSDASHILQHLENSENDAIIDWVKSKNKDNAIYID